MAHRRIRLERLPAIEAPLAPLTLYLFPVPRRLTASVNVLEILRSAHGPGGDGKRHELHLMRPLLVVEHEPLLAALGAEAERPAGEFHIGDGARTSSGSVPQFRTRPAKRLVGVVQRLSVQVLVQ